MTGGGGRGGGGLVARLEGSARALGLIKLANVGLTLLWGFAVTYVFVRALPIGEFQSFLLLVAFGNFTISAEFGLTSLIYARLRRHWLVRGDEKGAGEAGDFRLEEMGVLFLFLSALIAGGTLLLGLALAAGWVATGEPLLFLLFFLAACINLPGLLAKRALAAIDGNLVWEAIDFSRRILTIVLLLAVLGGLDLTLSVALQLVVGALFVGVAILILHRRLAMRGRHWTAFRVGGGHVRAHYLRDIGASAALTLSEVVAYNAPYFTIALATADARPMLLFDFLFKMARALSMTMRALVEAALPRITRAFHARDAARLTAILTKTLAVGAVVALAAATGLLVAGRWIFAELFDGRATISLAELALVILSLAALVLICVSVYVQNALGRFAALLRQSLPFLVGSLLCVPLALALPTGFDRGFLLLYSATLLGTALLHAIALRRLVRDAAV